MLDVDGQGGWGVLKIGQFSWISYVYHPLSKFVPGYVAKRYLLSGKTVIIFFCSVYLILLETEFIQRLDIYEFSSVSYLIIVLKQQFGINQEDWKSI